MAIVTSAGLQASYACVETGPQEGPRGWANVRPLDRNAAGAVGQWVDLLASISHEMRTPLNAVIGFSDAMSQEVFGPIGNARYEEYVRHIRSSGVELLAAAEDALAMTAVLAQPRAVTLEDVALAPLVDDVVAELAGRDRGRQISIEVAIPLDLEVRGDRRILPRAIRQLIAVAQSRAAPGSSIFVSAPSDHGLVELLVEVVEVAAGALPLVEHRGEASQFDLGLGRRELAMWLATALLDLIDCRLETEARDGAFSLRTTLEQTIQGSFFMDVAGN